MARINDPSQSNTISSTFLQDFFVTSLMFSSTDTFLLTSTDAETIFANDRNIPPTSDALLWGNGEGAGEISSGGFGCVNINGSSTVKSL